MLQRQAQKRLINNLDGEAPASPLPASCLEHLSIAWEAWANAPATPARKTTRAKIYLIFLLIRYGGLRLSEILNLDLVSDLDRESGLLHISTERSILLPLPCMAAIRRILGLPGVLEPRFLDVDPGFIRKTFYSLAEQSGLPKQYSGPRAIRYLRGYELLALHSPMAQIQEYLGLKKQSQIGAFLRFLTTLSQKPDPVNRFMAMIDSIEPGLRSVICRLKTFSGFYLYAISDLQANIWLDARAGMVVQTKVLPEAILLALEPQKVANCLSGSLSVLQFDPVESYAEVVTNAAGTLQASLETIALPTITPGSQVYACFPARALQLELV